VRFQVASGLLRPGDELPSTRALSQQLGVNPMTVSKSYGLLEAEGVLTHRPGLPLVVSERPAADTQRAREAQLRELLEPVAVAARQLGMSSADALGVFSDVLTATGGAGDSTASAGAGDGAATTGIPQAKHPKPATRTEHQEGNDE
jgi:GntR family transcriptional regulator